MKRSIAAPPPVFALILAAFLISSTHVRAEELAIPRPVHVESSPHDDCDICGMYIRENRDTAVQIAPGHDKRHLYCGVACGLRALNERFGAEQVEAALATDWESHQLVPLGEATLVIGSDVIPDMIPNIIAFDNAEKANAFQSANGGRIVPLEELLTGISYFGMTMPFRVTPAAVPPRRVFAMATAFSFMEMEDLMSGDSEVDGGKVVKARGMAMSRMRTARWVQKLAYAFTDDITATLDVPYLWREIRADTRMGPRTFKNEGLGDLALATRWRFWRDTKFDKHFGALVRLTLPTGEFSNANRMRKGLQLGTGAVGLGGGLSYSQHVGAFWLHAGIEYFHNFENSDDYRFGDILRGGLAFHYTPSTRTMLGLEIDALKSWKNEDLWLAGSDKVENSGRGKISANLVLQQRLAEFAGGNLNLRAMGGLPLYEDVNGLQLGEKFHVMAALQWKRRF